MRTDFVPGREAALLPWGLNLSQKATADPALYGLTPAIAQALAAAYAALDAAWQRVQDPDRRTPTAVTEKDALKKAFISSAREVARLAQAHPGITTAQREALGLNLRDAKPTPVPPPEESPVIDVASARGQFIEVLLHRPGGRRGRPPGAAGASVFFALTEAPPADLSGWTFAGSTTRSTCTVDVGAGVPPGAKVWLTAFYYNPRAQSGQAAEPISTRVAGGGVSKAA